MYLDYLTLLEFILGKIKEKGAKKIFFGCEMGVDLVNGDNESYRLIFSKELDKKNEIFFRFKNLNQSNFDFVIATL